MISFTTDNRGNPVTLDINGTRHRMTDVLDALNPPPPPERPAPVLRLHTLPSGEPGGIVLDGTHYPLGVVRLALRQMTAMHQIAEALGMSDAREPDAVVAQLRKEIGR